MHVVITGASSGLGEHLAIELGRRGHSLGLVARRADLLETVAARVRETGAKAAIAVADVTDRAALRQAVDRLADQLGPVDIIVANAGAGGPTPASRMDAERITGQMRLNFDGVVFAFDAVLPQMLERGSGQLVAVSSIAAMRGLPPNGAYSASKAAVTSLCEAFGAELRPQGIAVTTIHPGFVRTPLTAKNKFPMPFLLDADKAARIMADGILAQRRRVDFPLPMTLLMSLVQMLPAFVYEPLAARAVPRARQVEG